MKTSVHEIPILSFGKKKEKWREAYHTYIFSPLREGGYYEVSWKHMPEDEKILDEYQNKIEKAAEKRIGMIAKSRTLNPYEGYPPLSPLIFVRRGKLEIHLHGGGYNKKNEEKIIDEIIKHLIKRFPFLKNLS